MRTEMDGNIVESEVRHDIDRLFEQEGIVIAFPQRDVHLDVRSPVEVNIRGLERAIARVLPIVNWPSPTAESGLSSNPMATLPA